MKYGVGFRLDLRLLYLLGSVNLCMDRDFLNYECVQDYV